MLKNFRKISIIGPNGSGKTSLARTLGEKLSLPAIHIDTYIWGENWTLKDRAEAENKIKDLLQNQNSWIVDGYINYAPKEMLELADLVIYLNYTNLRAVFHNIKRWIKHRKNKRDELPEGCEDSLQIKNLFEIWQGGVVQLIENALTKYPPKNLVRIKSPKELKIFIDKNL
ncbi:MAG: hypothetical protein ABI430_05050 [Candidatus Taylorbacteria bacterium]